MKPIHYTITEAEFSQILRDFRAYGTPVSNFVDQLGHLTLIKNDDRTVYHLACANADGSFVVEIIPRFELFEVMHGYSYDHELDLTGFVEGTLKQCFPWFTPQKRA